jgi:pilus assembly protein Flp/PilA
MVRVTEYLLDMLRGEEGQTLTEYALVLILIAVVVILMITGLGSSLNNTYSEINSTLP